MRLTERKLSRKGSSGAVNDFGCRLRSPELGTWDDDLRATIPRVPTRAKGNYWISPSKRN